MKLICFCGGKIIPVDKESCKCSNGCTFNGNTKQLLDLEIIKEVA